MIVWGWKGEGGGGRGEGEGGRGRGEGRERGVGRIEQLEPCLMGEQLFQSKSPDRQ